MKLSNLNQAFNVQRKLERARDTARVIDMPGVQVTIDTYLEAQNGEPDAYGTLEIDMAVARVLVQTNLQLQIETLTAELVALGVEIDEPILITSEGAL